MNTNIIPVTICLPPSIFYFISFCYYKLYIIKNNQLYCSFKQTNSKFATRRKTIYIMTVVPTIINRNKL